ncbi:MAG: amidase [Myxococcota bacterium]
MSYEKKVVSAPRLAGAGLRAFARLIEQPVSGRVVRDALLRQLGLDALRAADVSGAPIDAGPLPADPRAFPRDPTADSLAAVVRQPGHTRGEHATTALQQHAAYAAGERSPVEAAEAFQHALASSQADAPALHLFIAQNPDDVRAQAIASEARWKRGEPLGPLDGVIVSVKDELEQVPYPTTCGTRLPREPAIEDATAVSRLRATGAILVGKVNMHELGSGLSGINPHWGTPRNPYDDGRICGGSSSGSGAIVGSGLTAISLACDAGGSIRMPAAFCGVIGLKATLGRISHYGASDLVWTTAHAGPMGTTASDVALAYLAMAGPDPRDAKTLHQPPVHLSDWERDDLRGVTLGVYREWFEDADPEIVSACKDQVRRLEDAGAEIRRITLPDMELLTLAHLVLIGVEAAESQLKYYAEDHRRYSHESRMSMALSRGLRATDYVHARRVRTVLIDQWLRAMAGVDAIVTPATGVTAPALQADAVELGESDMALAHQIMHFMPPGNLLGFPAITFPVGYDAKGMPIALQVMGRPWMEHVLLRVAKIAGTGVPRRLPQRNYDPFR